MILSPENDDYPIRLDNLSKKPMLRTSGPLDHRGPAVAIVGSRSAIPEALEFTRDLSKRLAKVGALVISGGALGIDTAAHEGAMEAGATWCVAPNGIRHPYPSENSELFERIAASERSRMIWPFADNQRKDEETPKERNRILVGLARVVVVVQARFNSGSRNAAAHARRMARPLFFVPAAPWMTGFVGSMLELSEGRGLLLAHPSQLFRFLALPWGGPGKAWKLPLEQPRLPHLDPAEDAETASSDETWTDDERSIFSILSGRAQHVDHVVARTGLPTSATITALLTLSLKDVVVEGPDGFYRRR
jgi:DNA processing protein